MENFSYSYCQASCDIAGSSKEWDSHFLQSQLGGLKYSDNRISWLGATTANAPYFVLPSKNGRNEAAGNGPELSGLW